MLKYYRMLNHLFWKKRHKRVKAYVSFFTQKKIYSNLLGGITYSSKPAESKNIKVGMTTLITESGRSSQVFEEIG